MAQGNWTPDLGCENGFYKESILAPDPIVSAYAGVVSRKSVRIVLTYATPNNLDGCADDTCNAYLQAPSSHKGYIICGPEFGLDNIGKC
eukprot:12579964-Ditylum_brightwellii.AAC.1